MCVCIYVRERERKNALVRCKCLTLFHQILKIQVMAALVGAAVFHGSFYSECYIVQVRLEYLVTGSDLVTVSQQKDKEI